MLARPRATVAMRCSSVRVCRCPRGLCFECNRDKAKARVWPTRAKEWRQKTRTAALGKLCDRYEAHRFFRHLGHNGSHRGMGVHQCCSRAGVAIGSLLRGRFRLALIAEHQQATRGFRGPRRLLQALRTGRNPSRYPQRSPLFPHAYVISPRPCSLCPGAARGGFIVCVVSPQRERRTVAPPAAAWREPLSRPPCARLVPLLAKRAELYRPSSSRAGPRRGC